MKIDYTNLEAITPSGLPDFMTVEGNILHINAHNLQLDNDNKIIVGNTNIENNTLSFSDGDQRTVFNSNSIEYKKTTNDNLYTRIGLKPEEFNVCSQNDANKLFLGMSDISVDGFQGGLYYITSTGSESSYVRTTSMITFDKVQLVYDDNVTESSKSYSKTKINNMGYQHSYRDKNNVTKETEISSVDGLKVQDTLLASFDETEEKTLIKPNVLNALPLEIKIGDSALMDSGTGKINPALYDSGGSSGGLPAGLSYTDGVFKVSKTNNKVGFIVEDLININNSNDDTTGTAGNLLLETVGANCLRKKATTSP